MGQYQPQPSLTWVTVTLQASTQVDQQSPEQHGRCKPQNANICHTTPTQASASYNVEWVCNPKGHSSKPAGPTCWQALCKLPLKVVVWLVVLAQPLEVA
jgi:hypothetical protein